MKLFIYLILLICIIIFCAFLHKKNIDRCPLKIKSYYVVVLSIALVRYITIFIAAIIKSQNIMRYVTNLALLNYIFIPALGIISIYIFLRDDKIKFSYNIILFFIITSVYIILILIYRIDINIDRELGYVFSFKSDINPSLIYLIVLFIIVVVSMLNVDRKYINKSGIIFLSLVSCSLIIDIIVSLGVIKIFPYQLIGESMFLLITNKAINTFKKQ